MTARLKTEREIYSKNVSNYENEIRKLEEQNITQKNSFADLEIQKIKSTQEKEASKYRHHKSPLEIAQLKQEVQEQKEYELIRSG